MGQTDWNQRIISCYEEKASANPRRVACVAGEIVFARVRVLAILGDFAARSDLPILRTALQFLC